MCRMIDTSSSCRLPSLIAWKMLRHFPVIYNFKSNFSKFWKIKTFPMLNTINFEDFKKFSLKYFLEDGAFNHYICQSLTY